MAKAIGGLKAFKGAIAWRGCGVRRQGRGAIAEIAGKGGVLADVARLESGFLHRASGSAVGCGRGFMDLLPKNARVRVLARRCWAVRSGFNLAAPIKSLPGFVRYEHCLVCPMRYLPAHTLAHFLAATLENPSRNEKRRRPMRDGAIRAGRFPGGAGGMPTRLQTEPAAQRTRSIALATRAFIGLCKPDARSARLRSVAAVALASAAGCGRDCSQRYSRSEPFFSGRKNIAMHATT